MTTKELLGTMLGLSMAAAALGASLPAPAADSKAKRAEARIEARSGSRVSGTAVFKAKKGSVTLDLRVEGAPPGPLAVHLHETGDCSDPEGKSAGPHWNPTGAPHGKWGGSCHLGDIGNIVVDAKGRGKLKFTTDRWTIGGPAETDILRKSIIVHAAPDDFTTQPTGNAGARIGCGVVEP
jgi:Cu-Zn family superoxide dismutase